MIASAALGFLRGLLVASLLLFSPVAAQVGPIPGMAIMIPTLISSATLTYDDQGNTSSLPGNVATFTSKSIGTASADRFVIVCVMFAGGAGTTLSVTIGGSSATQLAFVSSGAGAAAGCYGLTVTTGTTATIAVTTGTTSGGVGIWVYDAKGLTSTTPTATANATNNASALTTSINVSAGGFVVGTAGNQSGSDGGSWSWTNLTKNGSDVSPFSSRVFSGASASFATVQTGLSITATPSAGNSNNSLILAAMR